MKAKSISSNRSHLRLFGELLLFFAVIIQAACATDSRLTNHAFSFNAVWDSPDVLVLDYQYGESKVFAARAQKSAKDEGKVRQAVNINGTFLRGDYLSVKWQIKSTGKIYEDTVDLKSRLPYDITNNRIHFIVNGPQLYIYLVTPKKLEPNPCLPLERWRSIRKSNVPDIRIFSLYCSRQIFRIYPGQPEPLNIELK